MHCRLGRSMPDLLLRMCVRFSVRSIAPRVKLGYSLKLYERGRAGDEPVGMSPPWRESGMKKIWSWPRSLRNLDHFS